MVIVQQLGKLLPPQYVAAPRVHLGSQAEIDIEAFDRSERGLGHGTGASGLATAVWAPARTRKGGRNAKRWQEPNIGFRPQFSKLCDRGKL